MRRAGALLLIDGIYGMKQKHVEHFLISAKSLNITIIGRFFLEFFNLYGKKNNVIFRWMTENGEAMERP